MPDYTQTPGCSRCRYGLKKAIIAKAGRRQEDKDAVFHSSTKFALAELATRYNIDITDVLNRSGRFRGLRRGRRGRRRRGRQQRA